MGLNYIEIMRDFFKLKDRAIRMTMYFLSVWIFLTTARFELFTPIARMISHARGERDMLELPVLNTINYILIYMSKFTPIFLVSFIVVITAFLGATSKQPIDNTTIDDGCETLF